MCYVVYRFICAKPGCNETSTIGCGITWNSRCLQETHSNPYPNDPKLAGDWSTEYGACCAEHALGARFVKLPRVFFSFYDPYQALAETSPQGPEYRSAPNPKMQIESEQQWKARHELPAGESGSSSGGGQQASTSRRPRPSRTTSGPARILARDSSGKFLKSTQSSSTSPRNG